ncbi:dermonecrotic toxin domain-containing protein [Pseudomonas ogarae]|uniref:Dermonecrotic toxin N-terminal domain-containing protein n=1 Tax=Pseudomonas ogarae (strain DSM 112162 / CECT 30235 / F113) TaxID=1114970 RepID=A0ABM6R7Z1_PSEO1|nr:DUF6543 domain-containing protein [Pseudomonas ogarae]AEV65811.1 Hypothetical protein PSF113_5837 [Pseudomonas ogarae]AUO49584.1 hypothetical protein C1C98_31145 [Pseudomonas ogarae]
MTSDPTGTAPEFNASIRSALVNQLLAGPTYPEVAAMLLRNALKKLYPSLDLDPHTTVIGEPAWDIVGDEIVARPTRYESLSDLLASRVDQSKPTLLIEGLHFLTQLPITAPEVHLPVRIDQIGRLINELVPAMVPASQEQQLAYWNMPFGNYGPRWHELSHTLRKLWDVKQIEGWTATECDMARQLFLYPDPQDRNDSYDSHAYLVDIEEVDGDEINRVNENSLVVLIGLIDNKEVILAHSLLNGYEKFASRQALGQALPKHLGTLVHPTKIRWRLYEPSGNIFDSKACGIIAVQVKILGIPSISLNPGYAEDEPPAPSGVDVGPGESWFQKQLPEWLQAASISDQILFAQYMKNLSALSSSHAGKTYLDDIPPLKTYAAQALKTQMQSDHDDASTLDPEKIEIEIKSPVVWGTFVVPFKFDTTRFNLVDLALQNLITLPPGNKTVRALDATVLPAWLTVDYVEKLITQVDIGRVYPDLIKRKLLNDPAESLRRENLYTSQLRIQLPMLALEGKLRGRGNIDERGCRYVAALMEPQEDDRKVDGQTIALRKLAFVPELQLGLSEDIVANMFVIGPQTPSAGPCLLYRPLLEPQLWQFPSFSNLLYTIRQNAPLRQSVLAWLPDGVRETYGRDVFPGALPSPWTIVEFVAAPLETLSNNGPVSLGDETLGADFLPLLFRANANALVTLADHQSVSNRESRWESFKQAGWLIFNLALPYLGTTVATTTWLWQILNDLEELTQSDEETSSQAKWALFVDVLLNVSLGIIHYVIDRTRASKGSRPTEAPEIAPPEIPPVLKPKIIVETLAPLTKTELPQEHYEVIHTSGALIGRSSKRANLLDSFSIAAPDSPGQPRTEGALRGLYAKGRKWYAKMAGKWFEVTVEGDLVCIIDGVRTGPPLIHDVRGQWQIDTHLRLRGGGSNGARQRVVAEARLRSVELLAELNQFEEQKPVSQKLLTMDAQEMNKASGAARETKREAYLTTLQAQRENYEKALRTLIEWPVFQSRPDYPRVSLGYLNAQVNFTFAEMDVLRERFTPALTDAMGMITSEVKVLEQQHIEAANTMINAGDDMIERLDYMETRFSRLKEMGRDGFEFVRQYRAKMPVYKSDDLRLIQLDMYRHLCLSIESVETMPEGWVEINRIVDNATVAFQSLRDAVDERSMIRLDEQIDALGSLTEQFAAIEEHLDYMGSEYQGSASPVQLNRLVRQMGECRRRALEQLAQALDERSNRRRSGSPHEPRPRPRKKFIRARFWGVISGEPRLSQLHEETDWVDVKNPFSDEIIVSFHRKETGEWAPHVMSDPPPLAVPSLDTSVRKGQALIDGLTAFKAQIEQDLKKPSRTPAGVAMILNTHASRMEKVGIAIRKALDQAQSVATNETIEISEAQQRSAESLRLRLKRESKSLYEQEFETVLNIIKQSPPTMSGVIWLKDRNRISITERINRQRIKGPMHGFLDRYEIKDKKTNKTLWFADFHYSTNWVPARTFLSARLKTVEQVVLGIADVSTKGFSQRQLINHYRSEIAIDQAQQVFFPKERP